MSTDISTLYKLLEQMELKTRWFDVGQRIQKLSQKQLQQLEDGHINYPHPYLRQAWLALAFWPEQDKNKQQVQLWCLRLPLDEQGKLDIAARDDFLKQLMFSIGDNISAAKTGKRLNAVIENNPYELKLPPEKQASLHAKINLELGNDPSDHYQPCLDYLQQMQDHCWQDIAVQGIADVAVRWQDHHTLLAQAILTLPEPVLIPFCQCLEHEAINPTVSQALLGRLKQATEANVVSALIRSLSNSQDQTSLQSAIELCLSHPAILTVELLASLSSRCAETVTQDQNIMVYLEHLAAAGPEVFKGLCAELMFNAQLRPRLLSAFRQPERSNILAEAIGSLMAG